MFVLNCRRVAGRLNSGVRPLQTHLERSESPTRSFAVEAEPVEVRNSHWVYRFRILDCASGAVIWAPVDGRWSLDSATWRTEAEVHLVLRKYPGDHRPSEVKACVNCAERTARLERTVFPLAQLEPELDAIIVPPARA